MRYFYLRLFINPPKKLYSVLFIISLLFFSISSQAATYQIEQSQLGGNILLRWQNVSSVIRIYELINGSFISIYKEHQRFGSLNLQRPEGLHVFKLKSCYKTWYFRNKCRDIRVLSTTLKTPISPSLNQFQWLPSEVYVGEPTKLVWDIENVSQCYNENSEENVPSGETQTSLFYVTGTSTTSWYCTDLNGNRYPENASEFLTATITIKKLPAPTNLKGTSNE